MMIALRCLFIFYFIVCTVKLGWDYSGIFNTVNAVKSTVKSTV